MNLKPLTESEVLSVLRTNGIVFSSTPSIRGAFILKDGRFLNLKDNQEVILGSRACPMHNDLVVFQKNIGLTDGCDGSLMLNVGAIQVNAGSCLLRSMTGCFMWFSYSSFEDTDMPSFNGSGKGCFRDMNEPFACL